MQVRFKVDTCHAVGTGSVCFFCMCYFVIHVNGNNLLPFQILLRDFFSGNWLDASK